MSLGHESICREGYDGRGWCFSSKLLDSATLTRLVNLERPSAMQTMGSARLPSSKTLKWGSCRAGLTLPSLLLCLYPSTLNKVVLDLAILPRACYGMQIAK